MLRERLGGRAVRFAHIDSHHARECLTNDLELLHAVIHPDGIICLDDMLHPAYPMLTAAAFDYLAATNAGTTPDCVLRTLAQVGTLDYRAYVPAVAPDAASLTLVVVAVQLARAQGSLASGAGT